MGLNVLTNIFINSNIIFSPKDGVLGPMVGIISSLASMLAIKYLLGECSGLDKIFYFDYNSYRLVEMLIS